MAHRREFKLSMRQRIKDVAASRDLSNEDIKAVMTLKHHEIVRFTEEHGINVDWLLTGVGRVFTKDVLTSKEFAILVATIVAKMREMTKDRR